MLPLIGKLLSCPKFTASVVAVPVATLVIRRSPPTVPIERTFAAPPSVAFAPSAMELVPVDTAEDPIATPPAPLALLWKPNADEPAPLAVLREPYPEAPSAFAAAPLPTAVAAPIVALALLPMAVLLPPLATAPVPQASSPGDAAVAPSWVAPVEQTNCATAGLLATSAPAASEVDTKSACAVPRRTVLANRGRRLERASAGTRNAPPEAECAQPSEHRYIEKENIRRLGQKRRNRQELMQQRHTIRGLLF